MNDYGCDGPFWSANYGKSLREKSEDLLLLIIWEKLKRRLTKSWWALFVLGDTKCPTPLARPNGMSGDKH